MKKINWKKINWDRLDKIFKVNRSIMLSVAIALSSLIPIDASYRRKRTLELHDTLSDSVDSKSDYIEMVSDYIEKSALTEDEQNNIKIWFTEFLNSYYDKMSDEYLANVLWALDRMEVNRNVELENISGRCRYFNGFSIFSNPEVDLAPSATNKTVYHEFNHASRCWNVNDCGLNAELAASMIANGNYIKLNAIMEMLGDLGDRELLYDCLINCELDSYYDYLEGIYGRDIVDVLQCNVQNLYDIYYRDKLCVDVNADRDPRYCEIINNIMLALEHCHEAKYGNFIGDDLLFSCLRDMLYYSNAIESTNSFMLNNGKYSFCRDGVNIDVNNDNRFDRDLINRLWSPDNDMVALFTMVSDLADVKVAKGVPLKNLYDHLKGRYPMYMVEIDRLAHLTTLMSFWLPSGEERKALCDEMMEIIGKLYEGKYHQDMEKDQLFVILRTMLYTDNYIYSTSFDLLCNGEYKFCRASDNSMIMITDFNRYNKGTVLNNLRIKLAPEASDEYLYHEFVQASRSLEDCKDWGLNTELVASMISNNGCNNLRVITEMIGDLGNRELLYDCLINCELDSYYDYLEGIYGRDIIDMLKCNVQKLYDVYYRDLLYADVSKYREIIKDIMLALEHCHEVKYGNFIGDDLLFSCLRDMLHDGFDIIYSTNSFTLNNGKYSFYSYGTNIDVNNDNRFDKDIINRVSSSDNDVVALLMMIGDLADETVTEDVSSRDFDKIYDNLKRCYPMYMVEIDRLAFLTRSIRFYDNILNDEERKATRDEMMEVIGKLYESKYNRDMEKDQLFMILRTMLYTDNYIYSTSFDLLCNGEYKFCRASDNSMIMITDSNRYNKEYGRVKK